MPNDKSKNNPKDSSGSKRELEKPERLAPGKRSGRDDDEEDDRRSSRTGSERTKR